MIDYETYCRIASLKKDGLNVAQIARSCALDERTVRYWQEQAQYRQRKEVRRSSKLDAFERRLVYWLAQHPFSAQQLLQKLRAEGYEGGYSILKERVRCLRPPAQKAYLSLAFEPGECAQIDWGCAGALMAGNTRRRLSFFVMVLCYSRKMYLEFTLLERQEQFLACHQNAFRYFSGVPRKIMHDNLKSAVLSHPAGQPAVYHPRYLDFARYYGFEPRACNVRAGNEKGRVENAIGYVKKNFLAGRTLSSITALQEEARAWLEQVANRRIHAVTRRQPEELFAHEKLRPLPVGSVYDTGLEREAIATSLFRVHFDGNRYSVPAVCAGTRVRLRAYADKVLIYRNDALVATHAEEDKGHTNR
jgi:transposase